MPLRTVVKNWRLILLLAVLACMTKLDFLPVEVRAIALVPFYLSVILFGYLLIRSIFCRSTTDKTGDDQSEVDRGWEMLGAAERVRLMIQERNAFIIAGAIIVAGMLIIFGGFGGGQAALDVTP